jgi:hypothetical protein
MQTCRWLQPRKWPYHVHPKRRYHSTKTHDVTNQQTTNWPISNAAQKLFYLQNHSQMRTWKSLLFAIGHNAAIFVFTRYTVQILACWPAILRVLTLSLGFFRYILNSYVKLGHNRFLPRPLFSNLLQSNHLIICTIHLEMGACGAAVGWGTALQVVRSRVRFPMVSLEFFIDIILQAALWPWGYLSL